MSLIECEYIERTIIRENIYWKIKDVINNTSYIIPEYELKNYNPSIGKKKQFIKEYDKKLNKYFLRACLKNNFYAVGEIYEFKILSYVQLKFEGDVVNQILVRDKNDNEISVRVNNWQSESNWSFDTLLCEVLSFRDDVPKLRNVDCRHPFFSEGNVYEFNVKRVRSSTNPKSNNKNYFFELLGEDGCNYSVPVLKSQIDGCAAIKKVKCKVVNLNNQLKFMQVDVRDPFFVPIEDIISNRQFIKKYFSSVINKDILHNKSEYLKEQYEAEGAFWIVTYCDKVLPSIFYDAIERYDYQTAIEVASLLVIFEEWIISKGFIKAFSDPKIRKMAALKAERQLVKFKLITDVLQAFIDNTYLQILNDKEKIEILKVEELFYYLRFANFEIINETFVINRIVAETAILTSSENFFLSLIERLISDKIRSFQGKNDDDFLLVTGNLNIKFKNKIQQEKYFNWLYCRYVILNSIREEKKASLILATLHREFFNDVKNIELKRSLLTNAINILNSESTATNNYFSFDDSGLRLEEQKINDTKLFTYIQTQDWVELKKLNESDADFTVHIIKRTSFGFDVVYKSCIGFLPLQQVNSSELKKYEFDEIDFTLTVKCLSICEDFKFFIVKEGDIYSETYFIENNKAIAIKKGMVCDGYVRSYQGFGVFVNTIFGVGLLHYSNISSHIWDEPRLRLHFRKGKSIKVVINDFGDGRVDLSLKLLEGTNFRQDYYDFLDKVDNDYLEEDIISDNDEYFDSIYDINLRFILQKALCFQQLALVSLELKDKIDSLLLAKHLFSTANNVRSYLINIYIQFFEVLLLVRGAIQDFSAEKWKEVQSEAENIKKSIDLKTISVFPDSEKLVYFLNILILFNEKKDENIETLYNYVKEYDKSKSKASLKTLAKITLSNNLMISESEDSSEFSLRNLKLISSYLESGILSLKETVSDKLQREINEKVKYYAAMIQEDEGQSLEFKQTFLVPILDDKKDAYLKKLTPDLREEQLIKKRKAIKHSAFKTLCAFANTSGGILMIGVSDDKRVTGLEIDYNSLKQQNRDGFGKRFDDDVKTFFGESFFSLLDKQFLKFPEGDILIIKVSASPEEIFMFKDEEGKDTEELYIRRLTSSEQLKGSELVRFIKLRHAKQLIA